MHLLLVEFPTACRVTAGERRSAMGYADHMKGLQHLFRGLRTREPRLVLWGGALLLYGWMRKRNPPELVYTKKLRPGQELKIAVEKPQTR